MNDQEFEQSIQPFITLIKMKLSKRTDRDIQHAYNCVINKFSHLKDIATNFGQQFAHHLISRFQYLSTSKDQYIIQKDQPYEKYYFQLNGITQLITYNEKPDMIDYLHKSDDKPTLQNKKTKKQSKVANKISNWDYLDFDFMKQFYSIEVENIERGICFGDYTGLKASNQIAKTLTDCCYAVYTKEDYQQYECTLSQIIKSLSKEKYRFLQTHQTFQKLPHDIIAKLVQLLRNNTYTKHQVVYKEGELCDHVYFIKKGEFKMFKNIKEKVIIKDPYENLFVQRVPKKQQIEISTLQEGELFGVEDGDGEGNGTRKYQVKCISTRGTLALMILNSNINIDIKKLFLQGAQMIKNQLYQMREEQLKKMLQPDQEPSIRQARQSSQRSRQIPIKDLRLHKSAKQQTNDEEDSNVNEWLINQHLKKMEKSNNQTFTSQKNNDLIMDEDSFQYMTEYAQTPASGVQNDKVFDGIIRNPRATSAIKKKEIYSYADLLADQIEKKNSVLTKKSPNRNEDCNSLQKSIFNQMSILLNNISTILEILLIQNK